jgi:hypothetical protein
MAGWRGSRRLLWLGIGGVVLATTFAGAQTPHPQTKKAAAHRANEFTLAGLRPGRDTTKRAEGLLGEYMKLDPGKGISDKSQVAIPDSCRKLTLTFDLENDGTIQVIRVTHAGYLTGNCEPSPPSRWKTGLGLRVYDAATKVVQLYGEPDSKSPSTRDGQPLELWYYAFDWAGPDVPQVMEVLCTREKDGKPGRVEEITLAAPSL